MEADVERRLLARELLQVAAGDGVLLEHEHPPARLGQEDRVDEPGDAGADDKNVRAR